MQSSLESDLASVQHTVADAVPWLLLGLVAWALYTITNPVWLGLSRERHRVSVARNDVVPLGRMPSLRKWLTKAPALAGSWGGRAPPSAEEIVEARTRASQAPGAAYLKCRAAAVGSHELGTGPMEPWPSSPGRSRLCTWSWKALKGSSKASGA